MTFEDHSMSSRHEKDCETEKTKNEKLAIAQAEDKAVNWLRLLLLIVLVASALGVSLAIYFYIIDQEDDDFKTQFISDAQKVFETIGTNFDLTLGAADAFMYKVVSHAHYSNSTWPFVTVPDFPVQAAKLLSLSGAFFFGISHYVDNAAEREQWESYALENNGWVQESLDVQKANPFYLGTMVEEYNETMPGFKKLYGGSYYETLPANASGPFMPNWQTAPVVPTWVPPYNWDGMADVDTDYPEDLMYSLNNLAPIITSPINYVIDPTDADHVAGVEAWSWWASDFISPDENPEGPLSTLMYPILDDIGNAVIDPEERKEAASKDRPLGVMIFSFFWRDKIKHILPSNSIGIILVFSNECGNVFTYRIDGAMVTFLGAGDQHDEKFEEMGMSYLLTELTGQDSSYTGIPLDPHRCPMSLHIYPSQAMQDLYVTKDPIMFTLVVAAVFVFTSGLFLAYDLFVARRQRIIKARALASGAIVSSLFPENVADKLYEENEENQKQQKQTTKSSFQAALVADGNHNYIRKNNSKPIADLFKETSVYFADLAGFTNWSAKRTPEEVFELLESIYGRFDAIAKRRGVFKVETIGDCYVAVTGIPNPQRDHATRMVKFARDCMTEMRNAVEDLAHTLGSDTRELEMRVGIHSGSTTAGVLRGEKGRFQLFGDTVNTASRMESSGVIGRIHVSQTTADALMADGKGHWLTPREELITPKGKEEMQTYFVSMHSTKSTYSTVSSPLITGFSTTDDDDDDEEQQKEKEGVQVDV